MKFILTAFISFCFFISNAQLQKNVELEIVGNPTWQILIPMSENGALLFVKTDHTKAKVFMFDKDLKQQWDKEIFLDVERAPTSYTFDNQSATFLFRETSGMYYQLFRFDLKTGEFQNNGFELREYFQDQDYVFLKDKLIMAGSNEKGAAFYEYVFETEKGRLIPSDITGNVQVQEFKYNTETQKIESLWSVKTIGYSNEKKKKNPYTKEAFLTYAIFNTQAEKISQKDFKQKAGAFPVQGKTVGTGAEKAIVGTYQSNTQDKGLFYTLLSDNAIKTASFRDLLKTGANDLNLNELENLLAQYTFLMNDPLESKEGLLVGGVFVRPEYRSVTEQVYDPNAYPYGNGGFNNTNSIFNRNNNNTRSQTRKVFIGYSYPFGIVSHINGGQFDVNNRIDIKQISPDYKHTLSYNQNGSVAYCVQGNLAAKNFNIGSKSIIYKLGTEDVANAKTQRFLPQYNEVKQWYQNYFIADGSKSKVEVLKIDQAQPETKTKRKRKKVAPVFTQIRKTIYLTKVASGD
jgi:hypothetical protein